MISQLSHTITIYVSYCKLVTHIIVTVTQSHDTWKNVEDFRSIISYSILIICCIIT